MDEEPLRGNATANSAIIIIIIIIIALIVIVIVTVILILILILILIIIIKLLIDLLATDKSLSFHQLRPTTVKSVRLFCDKTCYSRSLVTCWVTLGYIVYIN